MRFFAANSLSRGPWNLPKPDYLAAPGERRARLEAWRQLFSPSARMEAIRMAEFLRARRVDVNIEVGE